MESFCALYQGLYPQVLKYFMTRGLDEMAAEELAQNVLFIVYQRIGDLRETDLVYGWVFKIARNELLQHLRRQEGRSRLARFEPLSQELAVTMAAEIESPLVLEFYEWMAHLERDEREIIMLRFIEGLSYEELSAALSLPLGKVKWRVFNAKKKLAQIIDREKADDRVHGLPRAAGKAPVEGSNI
ncbi:MAG TPA: sigma-70 family RNA polymerase sigma factor [Blastocatellia bacterium]|nr:sigma-70 family RNA polymerase sigma factor [Blastocatellia bacterium]